MLWKLFCLVVVALSGSQGNLANLDNAIIRGDIATVCSEIQAGTQFNYNTLALAKQKCSDTGVCWGKNHYKSNRRCGIQWALEDAAYGRTIEACRYFSNGHCGNY